MLIGFDILGYIGPGAGFAFLGSFLVLLTALGLVALSVLTWPLRFLARPFYLKKRKPRSDVRRVVVLGLDGLDPGIARELMEQGRLPHLQALASEGGFHDLASTCPPISPVAWSSFMTGANPGKHNIFDFLNRDPRSYVPVLSSSQVRPAGGGRGKPGIALLRKSKPFWQILGRHGVFSTILRVPITFPPEKFRGLLLGAMCIPDLRGTQGSFTYFTSREEETGETTGGTRVLLSLRQGAWEGLLPGPPAADGNGDAITLPMRIEAIAETDDPPRAVLRLDGRRIPLREGEYTDWVPVRFRLGRFKSARGICRFLPIRLKEGVGLYCSPINIDPERPALPISHPSYYSLYLAKLLGPYATLGIAEDSWAVNEGILDEAAYLRQVYDIHTEREHMFFESLKRTRKGCCVCVFDTPDRIQHVFFRYRDPKHPANRAGRETGGEGVLESMYERMDELVGRTRTQLGRRDVLLVMSDHGFTTFRRGVNLNSWLRDEGYLFLKEGADGAGGLADVDWDRTRAYTFGLSGIYLNLAGREGRGTVKAEEAGPLGRELAERLKDLQDPEHGERPVHGVHEGAKVYRGPYAGNGPDLVVGFSRGYRVSWDAALGKTEAGIFSDNTKCWCGDHCVDQPLVPGVLFSNRAFAEQAHPGLMDIAPTVLDLFGIPVPGHMDGRPLPLKKGE